MKRVLTIAGLVLLVQVVTVAGREDYSHHSSHSGTAGRLAPLTAFARGNE
jgi:hypothetical protein